MNENLEYHVTKIERVDKGYLVTIKHIDMTRKRHQKFTRLVDNPHDFPIGQIVDLIFVPRKTDG